MRGARAAVLALAAAALGPPSHSDELVLAGVTVIDGTGRPPVAGQDVRVRDGRIAEIRPHGGPIPPGALAPDVSGLFVVPGFVDMHAHVTFLRNRVSDPDPGYDEAISRQVLRICLAHGITTVRNPMAPTREGVALREAVASGGVPGPRIYTAGSTINRPQFTTPEEVRKEVRA
ncbi:MAG TPA: amidohydrolase family protein, partial [Vicinamibacteria bacterium]